MTSVIGLGIAGLLIVLGVLAILIAGGKSLISGEQDLKKIIIFTIPLVVFGVTYGVTTNFGDAGIFTMVFMMAAMVLTIVLSGFRSTFNL